MERAFALNAGDTDRDKLFEAFLAVGGGKKKTLKARWNSLSFKWGKIRQQHKAAEAEQAAAEQAAERETRKAELWEEVRSLATDPELMKRWYLYGRDRGLVREDNGFVGVRLTFESRLLKGVSALCLLRRGAAASGKNHPIEIAVDTMPPGEVIRLSGGSSKSLNYRGGVDDRDAFKGKILYVPEAATLEEKHGAGNEITAGLRTLISEGKICYATVVKQVDGDGREHLITVT